MVRMGLYHLQTIRHDLSNTHQIRTKDGKLLRGDYWRCNMYQTQDGELFRGLLATTQTQLKAANLRGNDWRNEYGWFLKD